jgi:NAD(P)-dependent dehydrogenase (short-subunit alcohol dehydrogenase family)
LTIGGSRNIGYFSSKRLLDLGATVTFLLRKPNVFDDDEAIQEYVRSGKARLVQGDALVKEDVGRAWTAAKGDDDKPVDFLVFTVGGTPRFELTKGFVISPPNLVTRSLFNCLETLPTPRPNIIAISSSGLTRFGHEQLPFLLKPVYSYLLTVPHADKCGAEEVLAHCAGWEWKTEDSPGTEVLDEDWKASVDLPAPGTLKSVVVVRPALLTDGACRGDSWGPSSLSGGPYKVAEGDLAGRWTVSRQDVAHFVVEEVVKRWDEWKGKRVSIAY